MKRTIVLLLGMHGLINSAAQMAVTDEATICHGSAYDCVGEFRLSLARGDIPSLQKMLCVSPGLINARAHDDPHTPLQWTIIFNKPDSAEYLIMNGANINARTPEGETAFTMASESQKHKLVELLLRHKADTTPPYDSTV